MGKSYMTPDGVEVKAELVQTDDDRHDFWKITFPDGMVKEVIDTSPTSGEKVFAANFKEVK